MKLRVSLNLKGEIPMKILIVDDDKDIVELLSIYVKNEGYEVEKAYNGLYHFLPKLTILASEIA